jgi:hypothetical protein
MSVPPADQADHASEAEAPHQAVAEPGPADPAAPIRAAVIVSAVTVAGLVWAAFFVALAVVYLIAFARNVVVCEAAAGAGLAISLAAALFAVTFGVARRTTVRAWKSAQAVPLPACVALAAASVVVIFVGVSLTVAGDTAGPWSLTVVAVAATVGALLARPDFPEIAAPRVPSEPDDRQTTTDEQAPGDGASAAIVVTERISEDEATPHAAVEKPSVPTYPALLSRHWKELLGGSPPPVAVDAGFWRAMFDALRKRDVEIGGMALTIRAPGTLILLGVVLPRQVHATGGSCEFSAAELGGLRDVIDSAADSLGIDTSDLKIGWVHTHPNMGAFLSGTDRSTIEQWRALDPMATPIVIDPQAQQLGRQIGVFDTDNERMEPVQIIAGLGNSDVLDLLKDELLAAYGEARKRGTLIILPGMVAKT